MWLLKCTHGPGAATLAAGDDVDAGVFVRVPGRALGPHIGDLEPSPAQALAQQFGAGLVVVPRRIDRGDADQVLGQGDQLVLSPGDTVEQAVDLGGGRRGGSIIGHGNIFGLKSRSEQRSP